MVECGTQDRAAQRQSLVDSVRLFKQACQRVHGRCHLDCRHAALPWLGGCEHRSERAFGGVDLPRRVLQGGVTDCDRLRERIGGPQVASRDLHAFGEQSLRIGREAVVLGSGPLRGRQADGCPPRGEVVGTPSAKAVVEDSTSLSDGLVESSGLLQNACQCLPRGCGIDGAAPADRLDCIEPGCPPWNLEGPLQATDVESVTKSPAIASSDGLFVGASFQRAHAFDTMKSCRHGERAERATQRRCSHGCPDSSASQCGQKSNRT